MNCTKCGKIIEDKSGEMYWLDSWQSTQKGKTFFIATCESCHRMNGGE